MERPSEAHAYPPARRGIPTAPLLLALLALALWLRLLGPSGHGFDWGDGQFTHPDENFVGGLISSLSFGGPGDLFNSDSAWNPAVAAHLNDPPFNGHPVHGRDGFNYGSLPLYLAYFFQHLLQWLAGFVPWWSQWKILSPILAGRMLSAIFDTITVYLVYLIGTRLAGRWTGLLAATLATFASLSIQLAHFTTVDTILTTFATGCVLACIDLLTHGRWRDYALVGIWLAAALATKASGVALLLLVLCTVLWRLSRELRIDWLSAVIRPRYLWRRAVLEGLLAPGAIRRLALLVVAFAAALFLFQPYTFSDFSTVASGIQYQSDLAGGKQLIFYTLKWHGTAPLSYPLQQLTFYSLGLPLALLAYAGVIYEWLRMLTPRRNAGFLVALFVVSYFVAAGLLYMKYLRYMEPIIPSLCVLAAVFAASLVRNRAWVGARQLRALGWIAGGAVLALTVLYGVAYEHIYSKPLTRVQSSCWIGRHITPGAVIAQDSPDETQPLDTCGALFGNYRPAGDMGLYDPDSPAKVQAMASVLAHAQYYIISSRRAIETFDNDAVDFPYTHRFYQLLFASTKQDVQGPLGYTLVRSFAEHPQLGPWTFEDYSSNQNFNEYDHPPIWIFRNTGNLPAYQLAQAITGSGLLLPPSGGYGQQVTVAPPKSLLLSAKDIAANGRGPSYAQMFPADGLPMRLPIVAWLLMVELLGLLALPISMRLFARLRDCGFVIAKTVGILLLSWFAWILPSLHLAEYGRGEIALCLLPLAAVSLAWGVRPRDVVSILRPRLIPVLLTEAVFLAGYGAFVWIRMLYPDMWHFISGGEKTMDFSFLNAIVRSRTMPPYDPWFSGGTLNYYYYGHFTVATLLKLAGIAPVVAINLAIPTFFALALATCVSIGYNLAVRIPWALLAGLLAMVCGNLYGARVLVDDLQAVSPLHDQLAPVSSAGSSIFLLGGIVDTLSFGWSLLHGFVQGTLAALTGLWQVASHHATLPAYAFGEGWAWDGSRVIDTHHVITEWPFWTFLFADPHAHMWDIPFALCILALAFNAVYQGKPAGLARAERAGGAVEVADSRSLLPGGTFAIFPVMGAIIGAVGPTNPWDLATMLGAIALATLAGQLLRGAGWPRTLLAVGWRIPLLLVLSLALYLPFYTHFQSFYSHIGWTITRHQTTLEDLLTHFGLLLFIIVSYLCYALLTTTNTGIWLRTVTRTALFTAYYWDRLDRLDRYFGLARHAVGRGPIRYRTRLETPYLRPVLLVGALLSLPTLILGHYASGVLMASEAVAIAALLAQPAPKERRAAFPNRAALWVLGTLGLTALTCAVLGYYTPSLLAALGVGPAFLLVFYRPGLRVRRVRPALPPLPGVLLTLGGGTVLFFLLINYWVLALLTAMLTVALIVLVDQRERQDGAQVFMHLLILLGLAVTAAGEIVYLRDFNDADPLTFRNNTIFKIYEQAWLMLGIAAGVSLARLLAPLLHPAPRRVSGVPAAGSAREMSSGRIRAAARSSGGPGGWVWAWLIAGLVLFVGAEYYPLRIVPLRVQERQIWPLVAAAPVPATLDGSAFLEYAYPGDYQAIQWINGHIAGSPVMLQSRYGNYRNFSAGITMFTGLPSVVNWGFEAAQQRYSGQQVNPDDPTKVYPSQVAPRETDVDTIYSTPDPEQALSLLHTYHVGYIYIGLQERGDPTLLGAPDAFHGYPAEGLAKFPLMAAQGSLKLVYNVAEVQIYQVLATGSGVGGTG